MSTINITNARANLYQLVSDVNVGFNPITIVNNKGKNAGLDKNCKVILNLMQLDPFCYPPFYEKLTGGLNGLYTRRINRQHRLVYEVISETREIHIIRMWIHYDNL